MAARINLDLDTLRTLAVAQLCPELPHTFERVRLFPLELSLPLFCGRELLGPTRAARSEAICVSLTVLNSTESTAGRESGER